MSQSSSVPINSQSNRSRLTKRSRRLTSEPNSSPFNAHSSAAPDKAASFKSLYVNRPQKRGHTASKRGGPHTALRLVRPNLASKGFTGLYCFGPFRSSTHAVFVQAVWQIAGVVVVIAKRERSCERRAETEVEPAERVICVIQPHKGYATKLVGSDGKPIT
jgi:hypothetical protein